jgi:hypothetical protein
MVAHCNDAHGCQPSRWPRYLLSPLAAPLRGGGGSANPGTCTSGIDWTGRPLVGSGGNGLAVTTGDDSPDGGRELCDGGDSGDTGDSGVDVHAPLARTQASVRSAEQSRTLPGRLIPPGFCGDAETGACAGR